MIPFYFFIKIIFLLYLFLPQFNGALFIYERFLKHLFNKYEANIDEIHANFMRQITIVSENITSNTTEIKSTIIEKVVEKMH